MARNHPYLREILSQTGRFEVRAAEDFGRNRKHSSPHDVAILNYSDEKLDIPSWSPATKQRYWLRTVGQGAGGTTTRGVFQDWANSRNCWAASAHGGSHHLRCTTTAWTSAIRSIRSRAG